jgi:hypothetical protein
LIRLSNLAGLADEGSFDSLFQFARPQDKEDEQYHGSLAPLTNRSGVTPNWENGSQYNTVCDTEYLLPGAATVTFIIGTCISQCQGCSFAKAEIICYSVANYFLLIFYNYTHVRGKTSICIRKKKSTKNNLYEIMLSCKLFFVDFLKCRSYT